jgi:uncharacterized protein YjbJ (UPF0337 family)
VDDAAVIEVRSRLLSVVSMLEHEVDALRETTCLARIHGRNLPRQPDRAENDEAPLSRGLGGAGIYGALVGEQDVCPLVRGSMRIEHGSTSVIRPRGSGVTPWCTRDRVAAYADVREGGARGTPQVLRAIGGVEVPNKDELAGRAKEAAGDLTDDKDLQREGKVDKAKGKAKDAVDDAGDKVKDAVDGDDD